MTRTTNTEIGERVAVIETKLDQVKDDVAEIKEILAAQDKKFSMFVDASEKKFLTRLEGRAIMAAVGIAVTLLTLYLNIKDKW